MSLRTPAFYHHHRTRPLHHHRTTTHWFYHHQRASPSYPHHPSALTTTTTITAFRQGRNWVEYANAPKGTQFSNMRPSVEPHNIPLWCLGNEMDGEYQLGHVEAKQYAIRAQQTAKMLKVLPHPPVLLHFGIISFQLCWAFCCRISLHETPNNSARKGRNNGRSTPFIVSSS
jgi:hypothetical protein